MAKLDQTKELLESIITAHGGLDAFNRVTQIQCTFNFTGAALEIKSYGGKTRQPTITINTRNPEANSVITNLGNDDPTNRWIFTPYHVSIESTDGKVLQDRSNPRDSYKGHTLMTKWDDLQLLYFLSYAMYNYLTIPWLFARPGFLLEELEPHTEFGSTWRVLQVTHPDGFPTHTKIQRMYFGAEDFLLKRMDYETDVFGGVAAHYVFDYKKVGGLLFPTTRRVVKREAGTRTSYFGAHTSFLLQYTDLKLTDEDGEVYEKAERIITK